MSFLRKFFLPMLVITMSLAIVACGGSGGSGSGGGSSSSNKDNRDTTTHKGVGNGGTGTGSTSGGGSGSTNDGGSGSSSGGGSSSSSSSSSNSDYVENNGFNVELMNFNLVSIGAQCQLHTYNGDVKPFILKDESYEGSHYLFPCIIASKLGVSIDDVANSYITCSATDGKEYNGWFDINNEAGGGDYGCGGINSFSLNDEKGKPLTYLNFRIKSKSTTLTGMQCGIKDETGKEIISKIPTQDVGLDLSFAFDNALTTLTTPLKYGDKITFECQTTDGKIWSFKDYARSSNSGVRLP